MSVNLQVEFPDPIIQKLVINRGVAGEDGTTPDISGLVANSDYTPAFSILAQQSGTGSPSSVSVGTDTLVGRVTGGGSEIDDLSPATVRTLLNVEDGATANQTASEIKTAYESNADTNAFADSYKADLDNASDSLVADSLVLRTSSGGGVFEAISSGVGGFFAQETNAAINAGSNTGSAVFAASNSGTGGKFQSVSGNHLDAGEGKFIVANNGNTTLTGTITASNISGTNTGDQDLSSYATLTGTQTLTNKILTNPTVDNYTEGVVAIGNSGATQTLVLTAGTFQTVTLTADCTFTMPTATAGKSFTLKVLTGAGAFMPIFTGVKYPYAITPTWDETASRYYFLYFQADGTAWSASLSDTYTV